MKNECLDAPSFNQRLKTLKVRYLGQVKVHDHCEFHFHDLLTNTSFHVLDLDDLGSVLGVHREKFYEEHTDAS